MNSRITKAVTTLLAAVFAALPAAAQLTASEAFAEAPQAVFPLLEHSKRLDMIDYFNSGMSTPSQNNLGGESRVTSLKPLQLQIEMTDASTYEIDLLPASTGDTLIAVIATVATPAHDSRISIYSSDYAQNLTADTFAKPTLDDWLTAAGKTNRADVEALVPFLLVSYTINPDSRLLTLTNNTRQFLSADVYSMVANYLLDNITYQWNGKKFVKQ